MSCVFNDFYLNMVFLSKDAKLPDRDGNSGNAGCDLCCVDDLVIKPGMDVLAHTGLACEFPSGFVMIVKDKSGRRWKSKIQTGAGVIDSGYRDEIMVVLKNIGDKDVLIKKGEKIAQFIIVPVWDGLPTKVDALDLSNDRQGGFGSTGV
jgi:dUTP pyrophosphatase